MKDKRLVNLEILRIISMLMIITLHLFYRSGALEQMDKINLNFMFTWLMEGVSYLSVDMFVLITAYTSVESDFKRKRIVNVVSVTIFYSILFLFLTYFVSPELIELNNLVQSVFPILTGHYWFVTVYILLCMIMPLINSLIAKIDKSVHKKIILICTICFSIIPTIFPFTDINLSLNGGTNLIWFINLYFIGGYIKKYGINLEKRLAILYGITSILIVFLSKIFIFIITKSIFGKAIGSAILYHHNSIFILIASCSIFIFSIKTNIKHEFISKLTLSISKLNFAVYIIHENVFVKSIIWDRLVSSKDFNEWYWPLKSLWIIIYIYIICIIIEYIRAIIFKKIGINKLIDNFSLYIDRKLSHLNA